MSQEYLKSVQAELAAARQPADKVARELYNQQASHTASPEVCKQPTSQPKKQQASNQRNLKEFANHGHPGVISKFSPKKGRAGMNVVRVL
jgi:hypothetical protein